MPGGLLHGVAGEFSVVDTGLLRRVSNRTGRGDLDSIAVEGVEADTLIPAVAVAGVVRSSAGDKSH
jgi:hypothetical protein